MNELAKPISSGLLPVEARRDVSIRVATLADLPYLDQMQKAHGKALGYFPTKQFEGYIEMSAVLIAHDGPESVGYIISRDRYLKRDELGVVYQLCVKPDDQRKLVGATLVRAVFDRSAYGCKLYCCWCAQDLPANHFWESMGFVPIAFRAGSTGKRRVHIFWQRRINDGDGTTPYWYPSMTNQGAIREDRLVFPIPPGTHWSEVQAVAMPTVPDQPKALPSDGGVARCRRKERQPAVPAAASGMITTGGLHFAAPKPMKEKTPRHRVEKPKVKIDPRLAAKARELRDRCMERVNDRLLIAPRGKYDVSRALAAQPEAAGLPLLQAG